MKQRHTKSTFWKVRFWWNILVRKAHSCWCRSNKESSFSINHVKGKKNNTIFILSLQLVVHFHDVAFYILFLNLALPRSCSDCTRFSICSLNSTLWGDFNIKDRVIKSFSISAKCISRPEWENTNLRYLEAEHWFHTFPPSNGIKVVTDYNEKISITKLLLGCYSGSPVMVNLASWQECWLAVWIFETWPSAGFSVSANPCCGSQAGRVNFSSWKILASHPCRSLWKVCSMLHSASASPHIWWILKEPWEAKLIKYRVLMTYKDSLLFVEPFFTGKYLNRYVFWF